MPAKDEFEPTRSLLNPGFDGYKLQSDVLQLEELVRFKTGNAAIGRVLQGGDPGSEVRLGWRESKSRAAWNHLAVSQDCKEATWIDQDVNVWQCSWSSEEEEVSVKQLVSLPKPIQSKAAVAFEYPAIISLGCSTWLVSDGTGRLYVLENDEIKAEVELTKEDGSLRPFRLHVSSRPMQQEEKAVVECIISYSEQATNSKESVYYVSALQCPLETSETTALHILWTLTGTDIPSYVAQLVSATKTDKLSWIIGSGSLFKKSGIASSPQPKAEPVTEAASSISAGYTWTQDDQCCTLLFALPIGITKEHIKVSFSPRYLTVMVDAPSSIAPLPARISHRQLGAPIDLQGSTWTFDPEEHTLTVSLEKPEDDTARWLSLFSEPTAEDPAESFTPEKLEEMGNVLSHMTQDEGAQLDPLPGLLGDEEDAGVEEVTGLTMFTYVDQDGTTSGSAVEVLSTALPCTRSFKISQNKEEAKPTASPPDRAVPVTNASGMLVLNSFGMPMMSTAREVARAKNAEKAAQPVLASMGGIGVLGSNGLPMLGARQDVAALQRDEVQTSTSMDVDLKESASEPEQEAESEGVETELAGSSLVVKRSYDGLLFSPRWKHLSTYPALAYVLASKRNLNMRFILHHEDKFCIAIESGGNVWAYFPPAPGKKDKTAKQAVARLDDDLGAVLGAGLIKGVGVVLLCEQGLSVIKGLL